MNLMVFWASKNRNLNRKNFLNNSIEDTSKESTQCMDYALNYDVKRLYKMFKIC